MQSLPDWQQLHFDFHAKCTHWQCPLKAIVLHSILRQRIVINKIVRIIAFKNSIHAISSAIQCNIVLCSIACRSGNLMCALLFKSHWTCKIIILLICNFRLVSTWLDSYFQFLFAFFSARSIREKKKERVHAHKHTHGGHSLENHKLNRNSWLKRNSN